MTDKTFIVLGIDQGLASCGYGVIEFIVDDEYKVSVNKILTYGIIKTKNDRPINKRLVQISDNLETLINTYNPYFIGCEHLFYSSPKKGARNKSASIINTNMVTGVIFLLGGVHGKINKDFVPSNIKKTLTDNGKASKKDMIDAIAKELKIDINLINNEHKADALSIAITTAKTLSKEELEELFNDEK